MKKAKVRALWRKVRGCDEKVESRSALKKSQRPRWKSQRSERFEEKPQDEPLWRKSKAAMRSRRARCHEDQLEVMKESQRSRHYEDQSEAVMKSQRSRHYEDQLVVAVRRIMGWRPRLGNDPWTKAVAKEKDSNAPEAWAQYTRICLGCPRVFLYSTNIVTVPYKRGKSTTPRGGWRVIQNPNYCLGNCMNFIFVSVPSLVEGLHPRAEPLTPWCRAAASSPLSHFHSLCWP
jgi:hypothetical protein